MQVLQTCFGFVVFLLYHIFPLKGVETHFLIFKCHMPWCVLIFPFQLMSKLYVILKKSFQACIFAVKCWSWSICCISCLFFKKGVLTSLSWPNLSWWICISCLLQFSSAANTIKKNINLMGLLLRQIWLKDEEDRLGNVV